MKNYAEAPSTTPFTIPSGKLETSRYKKVMHISESFFKVLASCKYTNGILVTFLVIFYLLTFALEITSLATLDSNSKHASEAPIMFRILMLIPILMSTLLLTSTPIPDKYKSRRHFSDLGTTGKRAFIVLILSSLIYIALASIPGIRIWDILAIICVVLCFIITLIIAFVNAQKATKLRFDPTATNHYYPDISTISKSKGEVSIIDSNVFKITLKNVGNENWNSEHFRVHRHADNGYRPQCIKLKLPSFTLAPQEQIDLIPETYSFEGKCIRIPGVHCFGNIDRCSVVKTFVADTRTKISNYLKEEDCLCAYEAKAAEFIAGVAVNRNEWPQVSVNNS